MSRPSCSWTRGPTHPDTEASVGHRGTTDDSPCWVPGIMCVCVQATASSWPCRITVSEDCIEASARCSTVPYPSLQWGNDALDGRFNTRTPLDICQKLNGRGWRCWGLNTGTSTFAGFTPWFTCPDQTFACWPSQVWHIWDAEQPNARRHRPIRQHAESPVRFGSRYSRSHPGGVSNGNGEGE